MYTFNVLIDAFIDKLQLDVTENTVNISKNDFFETERFPSLILQGPDTEENRTRRSQVKVYETDEENLTYNKWDAPRFYHFDFDFILTTNTSIELYDLQEKILKFFIASPELDINGTDKVHMHELIPMGGLDRPNLSNLKQLSGKYRLEDVIVFPADAVPGKLVNDRIFEYYIKPDETNPVDIRTHTP